jgi:hypothetical protein
MFVFVDGKGVGGTDILSLGKSFGNIGVLSPMSPFMKRWEEVSVFLLLFTALVTPFEIAYLETKYDGLFGMNRVIDAGFFVDMTLTCRLAYLDKKTGTFILDGGKILNHYLKGWFLIDAVSLIPWDVIGLVSGSGGDLKVLRLLKIMKLTKLVRIMKSARLFKRLKADLGLNSTTSALIKYLVIIIATMHWVACGWGMVAAFEVSDDAVAVATNTTEHSRLLKGGGGSSSSAEEDGDAPLSWLLAYEADGGEKISIDQIYALCIEYALSVMCMGYGITEPVTQVELWFSLSMMLIAGTPC